MSFWRGLWKEIKEHNAKPKTQQRNRILWMLVAGWNCFAGVTFIYYIPSVNWKLVFAGLILVNLWAIQHTIKRYQSVKATLKHKEDMSDKIGFCYC